MVGALGLSTSALGRDSEGINLSLQMLVEAGGDLVVAADSDPHLHLVGAAVADATFRSQLVLAVGSQHGSRRELLNRLQSALDRLGCGHVDVWAIHGWGQDWREVASTAAIALSSGRARYVFVSADHPWQSALLACQLATNPPGVPVTALGTAYSLVDRRADRDVVPLAEALEAGVIAGAPLAHGVLTGKYRHGTPPDSRGASEAHGPQIRRMLSDDRRRIVDGLAAAAEGLGEPIPAVALAWVRDRPGISAVVTAPRTAHQWRTLLGSADLSLPQEIRSALDDVSDPR